MKFAAKYYNINGDKWIEDLDEIIIDYLPSKESHIKKLKDFIIKHSKNRIIIEVDGVKELRENVENAKLFTDLINENIRNWAIKFNNTSLLLPHMELHMAEMYLRDYDLYGKIEYFFATPAETFEQLDRYLFTRVSDIYITNSLAFDLVRVKNRIKCLDSSMKVRVYPNICQSYWQDENSIRSFFIRPDDIKYYEDYVDVMELYAETPQQRENAQVYFKIYAKDKTWSGNLREYLINCNQDINNMNIFKDFGKKRVGCKKRCLIDSKCNFCDQQKKFLDMMDKVQDKILPIKEDETVDTADEDIYDYIGEEK